MIQHYIKSFTDEYSQVMFKYYFDLEIILPNTNIFSHPDLVLYDGISFRIFDIKTTSNFKNMRESSIVQLLIYSALIPKDINFVSYGSNIISSGIYKSKPQSEL